MNDFYMMPLLFLKYLPNSLDPTKNNKYSKRALTFSSKWDLITLL